LNFSLYNLFMPHPKYLLAIDQGTTGSRAFIFDHTARVISSSYREFPQYFPQPGWVEHDALEIWHSVRLVISRVLRASGLAASEISAVGITNQRETTLLWDRQTGKPVSRAIVWQCRRTAEICRKLKAAGHESIFRKKTGLVLDPYFSGTKIKWMLDRDASLRRRANAGKLAFGTMDSWLIWNLTGGRVHVTDPTNASRTLLYNIKTKQWDEELMKIFGVPLAVLPSVQPSGSIFGQTVSRVTALPGGIPIAAVLGDQQAALYGQGCFSAGSLKNTYGTGCFIVLNTGAQLVHSQQGLLTTLVSDFHGQPVYALEGAVFIAGAVMQWMRDQLGFFKSVIDSEDLIQGLKDTAGVYIVPAFTGLGVPHWDAQARGLICGLTRGAGKAHLVRAALESMAYQTRDVVEAMRRETGRPIKELKVDGGACVNQFLMQFQADVLNARILRPKMTDTTVLGAALLAGVTVGVWSKPQELQLLLECDKIFKPRMNAARRHHLYQGWQAAVARTRLHP
jgi:glycerol kinase